MNVIISITGIAFTLWLFYWDIQWQKEVKNMNDYQDYIEAYLYILNATNGGIGMEKQMNLIGELVEKVKPKRVEIRNIKCLCPRCHIEIKDLLSKYCSECGQKLQEWI